MKACLNNGKLELSAGRKNAGALMAFLNDATIMGVQCTEQESGMAAGGDIVGPVFGVLEVSDRPLLVDTAAGPNKAVMLVAETLHTRKWTKIDPENQPLIQCPACGAAVRNKKQHIAWHEHIQKGD